MHFSFSHLLPSWSIVYWSCIKLIYIELLYKHVWQSRRIAAQARPCTDRHCSTHPFCKLVILHFNNTQTFCPHNAAFHLEAGPIFLSAAAMAIGPVVLAPEYASLVGGTQPPGSKMDLGKQKNSPSSLHKEKLSSKLQLVKLILVVWSARPITAYSRQHLL